MMSAKVIFRCRCCEQIFTEMHIGPSAKDFESLVALHLKGCRCTMQTRTGGDDTLNMVGFGDAIGYVKDTLEFEPDR